MRTVETRPPSFPIVDPNEPLSVEEKKIWQVLCGDRDRWRVGIYSPEASSAEAIEDLEQHDCPEFFLLLDGRLTLLVARDRKVQQIALQPNRPILVTAPHAGFCPDGPYTGRALVVERDSFDTKYASPTEFTTNQTLTFDPVPEDPAG